MYSYFLTDRADTYKTGIRIGKIAGPRLQLPGLKLQGAPHPRLRVDRLDPIGKGGISVARVC